MGNITRGIAIFALLVAAAAFVQPSAAEAQQSADVSSHPWIGKAAPDFVLKKVGGGELKLKDLTGKYVVIHFGASW